MLIPIRSEARKAVKPRPMHALLFPVFRNSAHANGSAHSYNHLLPRSRSRSAGEGGGWPGGFPLLSIMIAAMPIHYEIWEIVAPSNNLWYTVVYLQHNVTPQNKGSQGNGPPLPRMAYDDQSHNLAIT